MAERNRIEVCALFALNRHESYSFNTRLAFSPHCNCNRLCFSLASDLTNVCVSELNKNPVEGFSAGLIDDNEIYKWEVLIIGPPDTL